MKRVLTAAVLIPVVLLIVFKAPLWLFALVVATIIILALREYLGIVEAAGIKPFHRQTYLMSVIPILFLFYTMWKTSAAPATRRYWPYQPEGFLLEFWWVLIALAPLLLGVLLVFRKELHGGLASVGASIFGAIYIGLSMTLLVSLRADFFKCILIVFVLFSVWAGDIAAYYVGKNIGKHKLAPVVSPNKSWEGAIASVVASVATAVLVLHFRQRLGTLFSPAGNSWSYFGYYNTVIGEISLLPTVVLGVFTNVAAQFGDLFESALKRGAGVKDSGTLLPGHGGLLDRIDALLFAIPVVVVYTNLTGFLDKLVP
jgi:phosphatidate cytidylyltransferase